MCAVLSDDMTTPYLVLTDNTTTVTILNGTASTNYILESGNWTPAIAGKNRSTFGGKPYADVTEELTLHIKGTNAADCYSKLATLTKLLDQADAWAQGQNVSPVYIKYAPLNATVASDTAPMYAVILGRDGSDETAAITLSNELDEAGVYSILRGVRVRFKRRGLWLWSSYQSSGGTTANGSTTGMSFSQGAASVLSPTKLQITNWYGMADGYVFLVPNSSYLAASPASDWTVYSGASVTRTASGINSDSWVDFAWSAASGNVILQANIPATFTTNAGLIDVYARFKVTGTLTAPTVRLINGSTSGDTVSSIPAVNLSTSNLAIQFLGTLSAPPLNNSYTKLMLDFPTVSGSVTFELESILLVARSSETYATQVMRLNTATGSPFTVTAVIDPRVASGVTPLAYTTDTNPRVFTTYGDIAFHTKSSTLYGLVYAVYFDVVGGTRRFYHWPVDTTSSGNGIITHSMTATRIYSYLVPQ